ncbi:RNA-directed DNA polymerase, eukaryota, reverse transcriptase zinc-binding domain protein [Tanacetum coccineum]
MTRLELFRIKSMWGNYAFDYACSMARGLSGGLISIWDPNMFSKNSIWCDDSFIIIKGNWKNVVGDCFMVNIYGPQDHVSKLALWNRLTDFMHHHNGSYIMFGDMNAVRNAQERFGTTLNSIEADHFNSFIDSFTEDVTIRLPDVRIMLSIRLWSDHKPCPSSYGHKTDFGPHSFAAQGYPLRRLRKKFGDLGCSKAAGPDGYSFAFVKKGLGTIQKDHMILLTYSLLLPCLCLMVLIHRFSPYPKANRLSKVIDKIVSKEQSAFIAGHQILDGPVILSEIIEWRSLSPFLFILVMEGLHNAFEEAVGNGLITGVNIKNSTINVSHLFYADDVIITTDWNAKDMDIHIVFSMFSYYTPRLSSWKANLLSIGGRLTLIKSVLGSLGIYYLSIFRAPESVLQDLERIRAKFFWGGNKDKNKMAWVKWPIILNSFDKGGLNIGSLKAFNLALLPKIGVGGFFLPQSPLLGSGCGTRIRFGTDYLGQEGDSSFYKKSCLFYCDMLNEIGQLNIDVNEDTCTWSLGRNGTFTVKDARYRIDQNILPTLAHTTTWDKSIPRKVNVFMWRLSLEPTSLHKIESLFEWLWIFPAISCPSCNANVESANHVFFECDIATDMWKLVFRWCDIPLFQASSWDSFNDWIISWHASKEKKHRFYVITTSVLWWLWRYRNSVYV